MGDCAGYLKPYEANWPRVCMLYTLHRWSEWLCFSRYLRCIPHLDVIIKYCGIVSTECRSCRLSYRNLGCKFFEVGKKPTL
ncbi:hypothetical protein SUGI_1000020 [Cryptomeria japonica]|nr:hypothetical protein SUGI_1000020 [Cryptomeria japonica]